MAQQQGEASENVKVFQTMLMRICNFAAAHVESGCRKCLGAYQENRPWNQTKEVDSVCKSSKCLAGTQCGVPHCFTTN